MTHSADRGVVTLKERSLKERSFPSKCLMRAAEFPRTMSEQHASTVLGRSTRST
jgi:hypothetical protein